LVLVMVMVYGALVCPPSPFAKTVLVYTAVGPALVPEIKPLVALIDSPAGKLGELKFVVFVACTWKLKATPLVPLAL